MESHSSPRESYHTPSSSRRASRIFGTWAIGHPQRRKDTHGRRQARATSVSVYGKLARVPWRVARQTRLPQSGNLSSSLGINAVVSRKVGLMMRRHLEIRLSQRNISPTIVSLVLRHGVYIRDGKRIRAIVLESDLRYLCADGLPERIA